MAVGTIKKSQQFLMDGRPFVISRLLEGDRVQYEDVINQRVEEATQSELLGAYVRGQLSFVSNEAGKAAEETSGGASYINAWNGCLKREISDEEQARVAEKLKYIRTLEGTALTPKYVVPIIDEAWRKQRDSKHGSCFTSAPSFSSVARWIKAYREGSGDHRSLVDKHELKGSRKHKLCYTALDMLDTAIEEIYLSPLRRTMQDVVDHTNTLIANENRRRVPSERIAEVGMWAVRNRIQDHSAYEVAAARNGQRAADVMFRGVGAGAITTRPLQRVAVDHYRMDIFVVDERSGLPLGRPWLTLLLDEHTRMVLGYHIGFEEPSTANVMLALRNAMTPKVEFLSQFSKVKGKWDAWGIIEVLVVDNGMEFHGKAIERITEQFGTVVQFCPRKKPWYKGKIERFFRTISSRLLASIPGKTFESIKARGDYDPSGSAILSLDTLKHLLVVWIVDIYHQTRHRTLQISPQQAWQQAIGQIQRKLPDCSTWMDAAFGRPEKRVLSHSGIEVNRLTYNSRDLQSMRMEHGHKITVDLVLDDSDVGHIWVADPITRQLVKVPALQLKYAQGLTRWQHNFISNARKEFDEEGTKLSLAEARARLIDMIEQDMRFTKRKQRQRQGRFLEGNSNQANTSGDTQAIPMSAPLAEDKQVKAKRAKVPTELPVPHVPLDGGVAQLAVRRVPDEVTQEAC